MSSAAETKQDVESKGEEKHDSSPEGVKKGDGSSSKVSDENLTNQYQIFDSINAEFVGTLRTKIRVAFEMFDKEKSETIGQEEVSTIMRYLGQYPSERDMVTKVLPQMLSSAFPTTFEELDAEDAPNESKEDIPAESKVDGDDEDDKVIPFEKFCNWMMLYMVKDHFAPDPEDVIVSAFKTLDQEKKGYIEEDYLRQAMRQMGSPFQDGELDSFVQALKDPESGRLYYLEYVSNLTTQIKEHKKKLEKLGH